MRIKLFTPALALCAAALLPLAAGAQGFAGRVTDDGGHPVVGATVMELSTLTGSVTDTAGAFAIRYAGPYPASVVVRCLGFRPDTLSVPARSRDISIILRTRSVEGCEVSVVANRRADGFEGVEAGVAASMVGADAGVEAVLKSQMGVSSNNELSSQYRVRGGSFDENLVYVNGIEIYRPFLIRSGEQEGLSFVNPDMVEEINFSAGGFDASYGDKMSSVLDVRYKRPNEFHAGGRVSLLGAQAHAEGSAAKGRLTHMSAMRYKTNQYLFGTLDTKGDYSPTFFDVQTYWTFRPSARLEVGLLAYYAQNAYGFYPKDRETNFGTMADARSLTIYFEGKERDRYRTCVVAADASCNVSDRLSVNLSASMFRTQEEEYYDILGEYWLQQAGVTGSSDGKDVGVGGYMQHARNNLFGEVYSLAGGARWSAGAGSVKAQARVTREHYSDLTDEWAYTDSAGYVGHPGGAGVIMDELRQADNALWQTRSEAYVTWVTRGVELGSGRLTLTTGARVAHQATGGHTVYSPRLSLAYSLGRWRMRLATGRYAQMPALREMKRPDATLNRAVGPQRSWQLIGGADLYFGSEERPMKFTVEAYYKWLRRVNPYSIDNVRLRYEAENCARAYAAGIDFKLNGELVKGAESWATLSIMQTREDIRADGHGSIPRPSDQRLQFSMMVQDYMPGNKSVTAMLNLFFGTGLPFGPQGCQRWQATSRMPGYKRVDLGLYKDFAKAADGTLAHGRLRSARVGLEVFNLFDFANTISYFWVSDTDGNRYGVPNYLTSRRLNVKVAVEF